MKIALPVAVIGLAIIWYFLNQLQEGEIAPTEPPSPSYSLSNLRAIAQKQRQLGDVMEGVNRFQATLKESREKIRAGSLSLSDATVVLVEAARQDNPLLLKALQLQNPDHTPRRLMLEILRTHFTAERELGTITGKELERFLEQIQAIETHLPEQTPVH